MTDSDLLTMLRADLQNPPGLLNDYLDFLIKSAKEQIEEKGITINNASIEDSHLIVMYASWLYRKRNTNEGMPRMLQYTLHGRLIKEKGGVVGS